MLVHAWMHACTRACVYVLCVCICVFLTFACHWTRGHDSLRLTMCVRECWRQGNLVYVYMLQPSLGHDVSEIYSLLQHQLSPGAPRLSQHPGKRSLRGQRFAGHGSTDSNVTSSLSNDEDRLIGVKETHFFRNRSRIPRPTEPLRSG